MNAEKYRIAVRGTLLAGALLLTAGAPSLAADAPKAKPAETFRITPSGIPNRGLTFVDYRPSRRSGHMGHALAEYARDSILAFYSNTSGSLNHGHTGYGWMEYRRSTDGGRTWGSPKVLDYSYQSFIDGQFTISAEKAVVTDKGTVVLFCCRNSTLRGWEPYLEPTALRSTDAGETWSAPIPVSREKGRIYDARYRDGVIYVLEFCNGTARWCGNKPEHLYRLYVSADDGATFKERGVVPFETTLDRAYGFLTWLPDGRLMAACYNVKDEYNLDCIVSDDRGVTWSKPFKSFCAKRIRNPQIFRLDDTYFLHGRSGNETRELPFNFVLYSSPDGIHWDEGRYLSVPDDGEWGNYSYYSNNCVLGRFGGRPRALIQASVPYDEARENVAHWWIDPQPDNK